MARLPIPGQDGGVWGEILNTYLLQSHTDDGSLRSATVSADKLTANNTVTGHVLTYDTAIPGGLVWRPAQATALPLGGVLTGTTSSAQYADGSIASPAIAAGAITQSHLADGAVTSAAIAAGTIAPSDLSDELATKIDQPVLADGSLIPTKLTTTGNPPTTGSVLAYNAAEEVFEWIALPSAPVSSVNGKTGVVTLTKGDIGLTNVDNIADADKPISTATQSALDTKAASTHTHAIDDTTDLRAALDAKAPLSHEHVIGDTSGLQTALDTKAPLAHTHAIADVSGLQEALDTTVASHTHTSSSITDFQEATQDTIGSTIVAGDNISVDYNDTAGTVTISTADQAGTDIAIIQTASDVTIVSSTGDDIAVPGASTTEAGMMIASDKSKLNAIASGATRNQPDAYLVDRANHTGTQPSSSISDFAEAAQDVMGATIIAGNNTTVAYDDAAGTVTIGATPGAGITDLSNTRTDSSVTILSSSGEDTTIAAVSPTEAGVMAAADKAKLDGIEASATRNRTDANLLSRSNHTGTQSVSTLNDFTEVFQDTLASSLEAGENITLSYDDVAGKVRIASVQGGTAYRRTATYTASNVSPGDHASGTIAMSSAYRMLRISTSVPARVRLYTTVAKRNDDISRAIGAHPTGDHGLVLEVITTPTMLQLDLSPIVDGANMDTTPTGDIPISVVNTGDTPASISTSIIYVTTEG